MESSTFKLELPESVEEELENAESKHNPEDDDFLPTESNPPVKHPLQCEICDRILSNKQSLKTHALTHEDPTNRQTFRCEICESTFKSRVGLNYHLKTRHIAENEREKLPCPTCGRLFKSDEGRKIHMTIQHGAGGPIFKCKECPMVFARKPHLELHMATHGAGLHVCTICGKSYARLKDLSRHEATCGVKKLSCPECGKQFRKEQVLENHRIKCHSEGRNFGCLTCGLTFATKHALGSHEAVHRRTFRCVECPQSFVTVLALRNHEQNKHWETLGFDSGVDEKRGRPRKSNSSGGEEGKVRTRRSKYDPFIGLEHLADPSTLIEEEKPVEVKPKPADYLTRKSFPCEHCPREFASLQAALNHNERRHWEVLGLSGPAPERRGRKRKHPEGRVQKGIKKRKLKVVNYVELEEFPEEVRFGAKTEVVDAVKLEDAAAGEPMIDDPIEKEAIEQVDTKTTIEEQISDFFETEEVIIKEEIMELGENEYDYFEDDSTDGDSPVDELTFEDIMADIKNPQEPTSDDVDALDDEPALETAVAKDPHIFKELVIKLEKLDHSSLEECSNNKPKPRMECEHCGKTFVQQNQLVQHRVEEHGSGETPTKTNTTTPPSYRCEECGKSYNVEYKLRDHKLNMHGIAEAGECVDVHSCKHCGKKLRQWLNLLKHLKIFHGETVDKSQLVKCPTCLKKFFSEAELQEHVCCTSKQKVREPKKQKVREPKERSFKCDLCRRTYASSALLEWHYSVHSEYQNFKCDQCPKAFFKESTLESHKKYKHASRVKIIRPFKSRHKNPYPRVECEHCGQTFAHQYRLALHRVEEHGSTETPVANRPVPKTTLPRNFHCDQCDKSYHLQINLTIHKAKAHGVGEVPPKEESILKRTCKHCKKQFTSWKGLVYHLQFIHGETIDETQRCPTCRLKFTSEEEMQGHLCLKGIVRERERAYKCDLCDNAYFGKSALEDHLSVHPEYQNFKCDQCPKGFYVERALKSHKKNKHKEKESYIECKTCHKLFKNLQCLKRHQELHLNLEFYCEHCGKKFKQRANLKTHMFNQHPEYGSEAARAARAIPCTVCGKTLRGKSAFRAHMKNHNNDRRYACSFPSCGRTFIAKSDLNVHMQSHTKDYKFKCKFCPYGTVVRKRILLHEEREHNHNRFAEVTDS